MAGGNRQAEHPVLQTGLRKPGGDIFASVGTEENEGLEEYLFSQFYTYPLDEKQKDVLEYLILSLDERGYFTESVEETAEVLKTEKKMVEDMLALLKRRNRQGLGQKICRNVCCCNWTEKAGRRLLPGK
ncbi:hypothetical protein DXA90_00395 [Clostridiaceae bacterium OF09-1]|nr:hypothetical protein DXA90_00395 [Clostridiaceae bacterium OF09-1]